MIFRNNKNQVCGELKNGIYRKKVSMRKHLFRRMDAWGIDTDIVLELPKDTQIEVLDTDNGKVYTASRSTLMKEGREDDAGAGRQVFLPRSHWDVNS